MLQVYVLSPKPKHLDPSQPVEPFERDHDLLDSARGAIEPGQFGLR